MNMRKNIFKLNILLPFSNLTTLIPKDVKIFPNKVEIQQNIPDGKYFLSIPGIKTSQYTTKAEISYIPNKIKVIFPKTKIILSNEEIVLPQLHDFQITIDKNYGTIALWFNDKLIQINKGELIHPSITVDINQPLKIYYSGLDNSGIIDYKQIAINQTDLSRWSKDIEVEINNVSYIKLVTEFPMFEADLKKPTSNCSYQGVGNIKTSIKENGSILYTAENYGVNCGHFDSDYFTPDSGYLMQINGSNIQGRSIKFFIDYNVQNSLPEEYLMPDKNSYSQTLSFMPITTNASKPYYVNWETRSHGKTDLNELSSIKVIPFPIERLSQIKLTKPNNSSIINNITLNKSESYLTYLYSASVDCHEKKCFIGIDQSYDDLWLAIDNNFKLLPHFKYNNWANLWEIKNSSQIMIVYIPQVIAFICLFFIIFLVIGLIIKLLDSRLGQ